MGNKYRDPQSPNEAILQNILGEENELREPRSVTEYYLQEILKQGGGGGKLYAHNIIASLTKLFPTGTHAHDKSVGLVIISDDPTPFTLWGEVYSYLRARNIDDLVASLPTFYYESSSSSEKGLFIPIKQYISYSSATPAGYRTNYKVIDVVNGELQITNSSSPHVYGPRTKFSDTVIEL